MQVITKNGVPVAVILSKEELDRVSQPKESLVDFFKKSPHPEIDLDIKRNRDQAMVEERSHQDGRRSKKTTP